MTVLNPLCFKPKLISNAFVAVQISLAKCDLSNLNNSSLFHAASNATYKCLKITAFWGNKVASYNHSIN